MKYPIAFFLVGSTIVSLASMIHAAPAPAKVSLSKDIQPIFDTNCVACHQVGAAQQGLVLESGKSRSNLVGTKSVESPLMRVTPGKPDDSYLLAKIEGNQAKVGGKGARMPLGGKLDPASIALIRQWVAQGATTN